MLGRKFAKTRGVTSGDKVRAPSSVLDSLKAKVDQGEWQTFPPRKLPHRQFTSADAVAFLKRRSLASKKPPLERRRLSVGDSNKPSQDSDGQAKGSRSPLPSGGTANLRRPLHRKAVKVRRAARQPHQINRAPGTRVLRGTCAQPPNATAVNSMRAVPSWMGYTYAPSGHVATAPLQALLPQMQAVPETAHALAAQRTTAYYGMESAGNWGKDGNASFASDIKALIRTVKGSREIQSALRGTQMRQDYAYIGLVAGALRGSFTELFVHKVANYAVATLFEVGDVEVRKSILLEIQPSIPFICSSSNGTFAMQRIISATRNQMLAATIVSSLSISGLKLVNDSCAMFAVRRCLHNDSFDRAPLFSAVFLPAPEGISSFHTTCCNKFGSMFTTTMIEVCSTQQLSAIVQLGLNGSLLELACDAYGNFVVQALLRRAHDEGHADTIRAILGVLSAEYTALRASRYGIKVITFCSARFPGAWKKTQSA